MERNRAFASSLSHSQNSQTSLEADTYSTESGSSKGSGSKFSRLSSPRPMPKTSIEDLSLQMRQIKLENISNANQNLHHNVEPEGENDNGFLDSFQRPGTARLRTSTTTKLRFDFTNVDGENEFDSLQTKSYPPGFGRRRSKSQGHLLPGSSSNKINSLFDLEVDVDPFNLLDYRSNSSANKDVLSTSLQNANNKRNVWANELENDRELSAASRQFASSFHTFENQNLDLDLNSDEQDFLVRSRQNQVAKGDINAGTNNSILARFQNNLRERAESDIGRYYSNKSAVTQIQHHNAVPANSKLVNNNLMSQQEAELQNINGINPSLNNANFMNLNLSSNNFNDFNEMNQEFIQQNLNNANINNNKGKSDWLCLQCGNKNYSWRHVCNMRKCKAPKPGFLSASPPPPGSWACLSCGNLNYAERLVCNMRKCRAPRPSTNSNFTNFNGLNGFTGVNMNNLNGFMDNNIGFNLNVNGFNNSNSFGLGSGWN